MGVILVVDDEPLQRNILKMILSDEGYETYAAASGEEALKLAKSYNPDVVLTDLKMDGMDGIELLNKLSRLKPAPTVIIMTAFGTVHSAVDAMKKGAFDYLTKPLDKDVVVLTVRRALERTALLKENHELQQALHDKFKIEGIIGHSPEMMEVLNIVRKVAASSATVLVLGESGTGKELIARAIHYNSPRSTKHFTAINCAAIPEALLESELFGYEPGSFTGAVGRKTGLFEASNQGTVFLDEIGDLPPLTQSKILRVLQEKEVRRLGGREAIKVDVRIIAATNRDLEAAMQENKFREDLFYRLKVVTINLPPLRRRIEDIPEFARFFLARYNNEFGKRIQRIDPSVLEALGAYHWPGNIRQLEAVIEKAVLMCETDIITLDDIRGELFTASSRPVLDIEIPDKGLSLDEVEKAIMRKAMQKADHVVAKAARLLGMSYKTFWYRWEKLSQELPPGGKDGEIDLKFDLPEDGINFEMVEQNLLKKAMAKSNFVAARAARLLCMSDKAFRSRWEKFGLDSTRQE